MTQPTPYVPSYSFTDFSSGSPAAQPPGKPLDAEFSHIAETLAETLINLSIIQRDDLNLRNGIVGLDQISDSLLALIGLNGFQIRGPWITARNYLVGDLFTNGSGLYLVTVAHTSTVFATDLAAARFFKVFDADLLALETALALPTGAAKIGVSTGGTLQAFITALSTSVSSVIASVSGLITSLAAATGSAVVGFIQSGASASTRTAQAKMREVISTSDFPTLALALAEAVTRSVPLLVNSNVSLTANTTSSATLVPGGGIITTGAFTLTVRRITGDEVSLFDAGGTGAITISDNSESLLGWFSPVADGATEDTKQVTRWLNSSKIRGTRLVKTILTDTVAIPTSTTASRVSGAGMALTQFKSKTGADIFTLPGVNVAGLNYVNFLTMGAMTFIGQGSGVGSGYGVHVPGTVSTGYSNEFYDMDSTQMGGGTFKDEPGLFSTTWTNLRGGEGAGDVFYMYGSGPGSVMVGCYPRNALAGKAGFRLINSALVLRDCNGLNVDSADKSCWAICGQSTSAITINVTTGGSFTIPAGPSQIPGNTVFENCNIESFPDIAIVSINGPPRIDNKTTFQTRVDSGTCIAVYCPDNLGSGIQGSLPPINQITLVGTSTWANSCPVWSQNSGAIFHTIPGDETHQAIPIWAITDAAAFSYSAQFRKYIGNLLTAFAVKHLFVGGSVRLDGLQATASCANDAAAAASGYAIGQVYRNGSVVQVRVV